MIKMDKIKNKIFVLGAAKSGTTAMHYALQKHDAIFMSVPKEPLFFEAEYEKGLEFYYERYYSGWSGQPVIGESRHRNLYLPYIPDRINEKFPDALFIVIARNPVERAHSHWWHWYSRGMEKMGFEEVVERNIRMKESGVIDDIIRSSKKYKDTLDLQTGYSTIPSYIDSGYYAIQINRYIEKFGRHKIHIILFDELIKNPVGVMREVGNFLGLANLGEILLEPRNKAMSQVGHIILKYAKRVPLRGYLPSNIRRDLGSILQSALSSREKKPKISHSIYNELMCHYASHIAQFESLCGRSIVEWKRKKGREAG